MRDSMKQITGRLRFTIALAAFSVGVPCMFAAERPVAPWPPPSGQLRLIIDTDAANEIDDQHALALVLGSLDRFRLEGMVAAHFGEAGGAKGIDKSYAELERVLDKAGLSHKYPLLRGADPLHYRD
jgi:purine nucleosidase